MENFIAQPGDLINTTEISPLRGPFLVLSTYADDGFCYYRIALPERKRYVATLRNKDIAAVIL